MQAETYMSDGEPEAIFVLGYRHAIISQGSIRRASQKRPNGCNPSFLGAAPAPGFLCGEHLFAERIRQRPHRLDRESAREVILRICLIKLFGSAWAGGALYIRTGWSKRPR